jgi:hypothetical protein
VFLSAGLLALVGLARKRLLPTRFEAETAS